MAVVFIDAEPEFAEAWNVRVSGNRDQGRPASGGYRYGYAPTWAVEALARAAYVADATA